jgi:hypothetical protein
MIKVLYNGLGAGDWVMVMNGDEVLFNNHQIEPWDLVSILEGIGVEVEYNDEVEFD